MTNYDCNYYINEKINILKNLLRGDKDLIINGAKSLKGQLADGIKTLCKKWLTSQIYNEGDIVGFNGLVYISKIDNNLNNNPAQNRNYWSVYTLPFFLNQGKVKAYICFKSDLSIIDSYNISSISEATNSQFYINFTSALNTTSIAAFGIPENGNSVNMGISLDSRSSTSLKIRLYTTDTNRTTILNVTDNNNTYNTIIFYSIS